MNRPGPQWAPFNCGGMKRVSPKKQQATEKLETHSSTPVPLVPREGYEKRAFPSPANADKSDA